MYWVDPITIALEVYYKHNLQYTILHIEKWKKNITIISRTRTEKDEI